MSRVVQMRYISIVLLVFSCLLTTTSRAQENKVLACSEKVRANFQGQSAEIVEQLIKLGAVSLGDAGETDDWEKYLDRFRRFVSYFDSAFTNQELIKIVQRNDCPLVTCYAFHALVNSQSDRISDKTVQHLLVPFAKDTVSVSLDWGCSSTLTPMFDFLSLVTDKNSIYYLAGIKPLARETVEKILEERRPYFKEQDAYGAERTWQSYREKYLN